MKSENSKGFTLIELMVVIAVIAILSGVTFRLMSAAGLQKQRATTITKMERIQNALSGYYAVYGTYPPVPFYNGMSLEGSLGTNNKGDNMSGEDAATRAKHIAGSQPFAFGYPFAKELSDWVQENIRRDPRRTALGVLDPHKALGTLNLGSEDWEKNRAFYFGLMSYLLPRVEMISFDGGIDIKFFESALWAKNNGSSAGGGTGAALDKLARLLSKQRVLENEACAKWLPNFENMVSGVVEGTEILGVSLHCADRAELDDRDLMKSESVLIVLQMATMVDGWGQEFFYYSPPPHQSYRLWSAGPNKNTFPSWIPSSEYGSTGLGVNADTIRRWIADDLVAGSTGGK